MTSPESSLSSGVGVVASTSPARSAAWPRPSKRFRRPTSRGGDAAWPQRRRGNAANGGQRDRRAFQSSRAVTAGRPVRQRFGEARGGVGQRRVHLGAGVHRPEEQGTEHGDEATDGPADDPLIEAERVQRDEDRRKHRRALPVRRRRACSPRRPWRTKRRTSAPPSREPPGWWCRRAGMRRSARER